MRRFPRLMPALLLALFTVTVGPCLAADDPLVPQGRGGAVIVRAPAADASAGLLPDDRVLAWRAEDPTGLPEGLAGREAAGAVQDPFALERLEHQIGRLTPVTLRVVRRGELLSVTLHTAPWRLELWPDVDPEAVESLRDAAARREAYETRTRVQAERLLAAGRPLDAAWLHGWLGDRLIDGGRANEASAEYARALDLLSGLPHPAAEAALRRRAADAALRQGRADAARDQWTMAIAAEERAAGESLVLAHTLTQAASAAQRAGDAAGARTLTSRAQAMRRSLAPGTVVEAAGWIAAAELSVARREFEEAEASLRHALALLEPRGESPDLANALESLGIVHQRRGSLDAADESYRRALGIRERLVPGTLDHGKSYNSLAIIASMRGDLAAADDLYERGAAILDQVAAESSEMAALLNNRGILALLRGRLEEAERFLSRALALKERLGATPLDRSSTIHNLALTALERLDLDLAQSYLTDILELRRRVVPESAEIASTYNLLAGVERRRGNLDAAEAHAGEALRLRQRLMPDSLEAAFTLVELGRILEARGDETQARVRYIEALGVRERLARESTSVAEILDLVAAQATRAGDLAIAREYAERSLAIWGRLAPDSFNQASALVAVARLDRAQGRADRALDGYRRAVEALELHTGRLGGSQEAQAGFRASVSRFFTEYVDLLLDAGENDQAFHALERSRARTFLAMLAERDFVFGSDVPDALESARRLAAREYDRVQARLASRDAGRDAEEVAQLTRQLGELRATQARIAGEIRDASPRIAALRHPQPVTIAQARDLLDEGTLALSYSAGERELVIFAFSRTSSLQVARVPVGRTELAEQVMRFRRVIARGRFTPGDLDEPVRAGRELYRVLVQPFDAVVARHERILVVPDTPLLDLPFAALVRSAPPGRAATRDTFLTEWRPVHQVSSLTALEELRRRRAAGPAVTAALVAFGDPTFAGAAAGVAPGARVSSLTGALDRLPGSRREIELIGRLFRSDARLVLGPDATERRLKTDAPRARFLHLATHGVLHARRPLDSGLAFAAPEGDAETGDNGLLQAWEIYEQLRLEADLVVLSACETGLGGVFAGEGLLGLTRAFQFAGAAAVVGSLWHVPDDSTPALMNRFYREIARGRALDEALATAQRATLARAGSRHPYYWAAFVLDGLRR